MTATVRLTRDDPAMDPLRLRIVSADLDVIGRLSTILRFYPGNHPVEAVIQTVGETIEYEFGPSLYCDGYDRELLTEIAALGFVVAPVAA